MCNYIHDEGSTPIPNTGLGWKLFSVNDNNQLVSFVILTRYSFNRVGIVKNINYPSQGFCFFITRKEARRALKAWKVDHGNEGQFIRRIKYWGGMVKQKESYFVRGNIFEIALCRKFKILKEGCEK